MSRRRNGMDAFTKKHLKAWLQGSVFSADRRKVGKIIRIYVKRHPEVLEESRSWPEIQRLAEASGINPRDTSVLQKKREARERAALIREASGRNPRRVSFDAAINKYIATKFLKKYGNLFGTGETKAAAVRNLKAAIDRAKSGGHNPSGYHVKHIDTDANVVRFYGPFDKETAEAKAAHLRLVGHKAEVVSGRGANPAELMIIGANPRVEVVHSPNPPAEEIVEEFTGQDAAYLDVYNEPHMPRGRYAQLGPLIALYVKPLAGGQVKRIGAPEAAGHDFAEYWGGRAPVVVCDSSTKQIYFVDGAQDISESLEALGAVDCGNGIYELGAGRRIDYQCRKDHVASPDEDLWKHDHGEENGLLPTVLFDSRNKRILYEGGDYRIDGPWIRN